MKDEIPLTLLAIIAGIIAISKFVFDLGLSETQPMYLFGGILLIVIAVIFYDGGEHLNQTVESE